MSPSARNLAIARIKTAMIEKKMTQAELADAADCHEKTVQNLLNGRSVRDQTLFDVCMVLGLDFDAVKQEWLGEAGGEFRDEPGAMSRTKDVAPVYMGAYTRPAVDHYIGSYLTLRPAFAKDNVIMAYRTDISWDDSWPSLLFQEHDRADRPYSHRGRLYVPASSMFIHLVSLTKGAMRMVVVSQLDQGGYMRGLITTLNKQGAQFQPVSTPIVYCRLDEPDGETFGEISKSAPAFKRYKSVLEEAVTAGYCRLQPV